MQLNIINYGNNSLKIQLTVMFSSAQKSIGVSLKSNLV
jgi:hypothetical protein